MRAAVEYGFDFVAHEVESGDCCLLGYDRTFDIASIFKLASFAGTRYILINYSSRSLLKVAYRYVMR